MRYLKVKLFLVCLFLFFNYSFGQEIMDAVREIRPETKIKSEKAHHIAKLLTHKKMFEWNILEESPLKENLPYRKRLVFNHSYNKKKQLQFEVEYTADIVGEPDNRAYDVRDMNTYFGVYFDDNIITLSETADGEINKKIKVILNEKETEIIELQDLETNEIYTKHPISK